jgi:Asp-tRNA(Asn)/Glu-tRNA(Gln) amidotransferase A subunit family amidase
MADACRREVLVGLAALAAASRGFAAPIGSRAGPGSPPPFGTEDLAGFERIAGLSFTDAERELIIRTADEHVDLVQAIAKAGELPNELAPATVFRAGVPGEPETPVTVGGDPRSLPADPPAVPDDETSLAFAPLHRLAAWMRRGELSSERLVRISLERIRRLDPTLRCVITACEETALAEARAADRDLAAGRWRGPLHGLPYGLKDLFDTAGIRTTWGAEPWRDRVPDRDAWIVSRLREAGAVLVAKTAVGALAYGDIWFGGTCRSPWNPERGSSGSSAGSAAGTAAGLWAFAIGTETLGSIVSPCLRCGTVGLRPTFGRVPRTGGMSLVWSMDKVGPIARSVSDTALVLAEINGFDASDPSSVDRPFHDDPGREARGLRIGYVRKSCEEDDRAPLHRAALEALRDAGCEPVAIDPPAIDTTPLLIPLMVEASAAFASLTRSNRDDDLSWQAPEAWPNTFRRTWLLPAVPLVQADRLRRRAMEVASRFFGQVDAVLSPGYADGLLTLTNATGHPSLTLPVGFDGNGEPYGMSLMGRLFDEGTLLRAGRALEARVGLGGRRPAVG